MKIQFEQTLHGYYKGHGLIATSISNLNQEDASLMATLSDWTGYRGSKDEDDNYLTVYPYLQVIIWLLLKHGMPRKWRDLVVFGLILCWYQLSVSLENSILETY